MFLLLSSLMACKGTLISITIEESSDIVVEQGTPLEVLLSDFGFGDFANLDISSRQELENQGVDPGDINSMTFESLTLEVLDPSGGDLAFIESLSFNVSADGLPTELVASQDDFPSGVGFVALDLEDIDLTDYATAPSMDLTTDVEGRRPDADTTIRAAFALKVGATQQGVFKQLKKN